MGILDALGKIDKLAGLALFVGAIFIGIRGYQIGKDVYGRVETVVCNYELPFGLGSVCKEEPTVEECYQGEFINGVCTETITPPPVVVTVEAECNPLDSCRATGQQLTKCLTTRLEYDDKGNSICNCGYDQQCEDDHLQQECQSKPNQYWEFGQCKTTTTTESIDAVTGEKVQDILDKKFVDAGGDLQKCEDQGGIVIGNYFTLLASDAVTTCVPNVGVEPVTTRYSLERDCQDYCNRNNYDIGSINVQTNTCVCDGVPQIHLGALTGLSTADIDKVLS